MRWWTGFIAKWQDLREKIPGLPWLLAAGILVVASLFIPDFREEFKQNLYTFIISLGGIFFIMGELHAQRELKKMEVQAKLDELDFSKQKYKEQRDYSDDLDRRVTHISESLAINIAKELEAKPDWACTALEQAKLNPHGKSLFSERLSHYREEKEYLAREFTPLLVRRCRRILSEDLNRHIYLVIDSGTTLYPLFEKLGEEFLKYVNDEWIDRITIVTNNLPGIQQLMESARVEPTERYSGLAVDCYLLPGAPIPIYSAIAGPATNLALRSLREQATNPLFIGILTGNYIRMRRSDPPCPNPLARGREHLSFKETLFQYCQEIFVLAPLGKIFHDLDPDQINTELGFHAKNPSRDRQPYYEIKEEILTDDKAKYVRLVSTSRPSGKVLSNLSMALKSMLRCRDTEPGAFEKTKEAFIQSPSDKIPHLLFLFDRLPADFYSELAVEFPHQHITDRLKANLFLVDFPNPLPHQ